MADRPHRGAHLYADRRPGADCAALHAGGRDDQVAAVTCAGSIGFEIHIAIQEADDIGEARGGSTITQQTAKNLFLWPGRSFVRKALEFPLALWIDLVLPKRRIMEIYLNIAQWGPHGEFGAEAGARAAFGKSAADLDRRQSALLAAILPNPLQRSARAPGSGVRRLAGIYEARARNTATFAGCIGASATGSRGAL